MAHFVVTPWRSVDELLEVRDVIFKDFSDSPSISPSSAAVQRIHVWKERGNLPHAVESTGQLLEALLVNERESQTALQNEFHSADSFLVRATYTAAITRFVTGFADLGRSRSGPGQSMLEVARDIDLPVAFVELRHEATHEGMPNLARLRKAATDALIWLKRVYWDKIETIENEGTPAAHFQLGFPTAELEASHGTADIRTALKDYRRARKANLQSGKDTNKSLEETATMRLGDLASSMQRGNRIVAEAFCTPGILLPNTQVR
ncbi:Las1-like-domain-containing protein [Elsinoe ampelina]|uniref:Las1-like-domain-containing protein n=1 Tax=Elsinoe ampelina TaxID=302913 RepID=A0A6A6GJN1_9PEZI|nr:Las1-like-domain-containing protein [Elsinoe ampelina]